MSDLPPANWYPDPEDPSQQRYWDGAQWTEHRAPAAASGPAAGQQAPAWQSSSPAPSWGGGAAAAQGTNGLAIASLVVAILSFFLAFVAIGGLGGVVAVILGIVALRRVRDNAQGGRGLAVAGIVVGGLAVLLGIVMTIVFVFVGTAIESGDGSFIDFLECVEEESRTGQDLDCQP